VPNSLPQIDEEPKEKVPLLALSIVSCVVTVQAQGSEGSIRGIDAYPLWTRFANASIAYTAYLWKAIWPAKLADLYPHPGDSVSLADAAISAVVLALITATVFVLRKQHPYALTGWLWFAGTLVPVIGIVQAGGQAMADRYAYMPLLGILLVAAWGMARTLGGGLSGKMGLGAAAIAILLLSALTWSQSQYWKNTRTLFAHTLDVTGDSAVAHLNFGLALQRDGEIAEAEKHIMKALEIRPNLPIAYNNLGFIEVSRDNMAGAKEMFGKALALDPDYGEARYNYANAMLRLNDYAGATQNFSKALETLPESHPMTTFARQILSELTNQPAPNPE